MYEFTNQYDSVEQAQYAADYYAAKGFTVEVNGLKVRAVA